MQDSNLGIIGLGFVGQAVYHGLIENFKINTYDIVKNSTCGSIGELCDKSRTIFVCVPTPMKSNGECDISIVRTVLEELDRNCSEQLIILKSTLPPTTTDKFANEFKNLSLVFNPEFLTEANHLKDFVECNRVILGGPPENTSRAKRLYEARFPEKQIVETSSSVAEMVKYVANTFLATKVSFANEINQICKRSQIDYDDVIKLATLDERLGESHWEVPGPDGHYGFGGSCFPKDVNGLASFASQIGIEPSMLLATWHKNLEVRPEKDWESLIGRAITKEKNNE